MGVSACSRAPPETLVRVVYVSSAVPVDVNLTKFFLSPATSNTSYPPTRSPPVESMSRAVTVSSIVFATFVLHVKSMFRESSSNRATRVVVVPLAVVKAPPM